MENSRNRSCMMPCVWMADCSPLCTRWMRNQRCWMSRAWFEWQIANRAILRYCRNCWNRMGIERGDTYVTMSYTICNILKIFWGWLRQNVRWEEGEHSWVTGEPSHRVSDRKPGRNIPQILIFCWPYISIYLFININQLDALNFFYNSLFQASTCFEHMCSSSGGQKLYYTVSGVITPIGGCPVHGTATYRVWWYQRLYNTIFTLLTMSTCARNI